MSNPRGELVLRVTVALGVIDTIAVILRIFSRRLSKASFALDDWLIVLSLIPTYSMLIAGGFCSSATSDHEDSC